MMMPAIILSIGAIYAFIPIVIILILLAAARSATGFGELFQIFGISTLLGFRGAGSGGAGRGISRQTKYTPAKTTRAKAGAVGGGLFEFKTAKNTNVKGGIPGKAEKPAPFGYRKLRDENGNFVRDANGKIMLARDPDTGNLSPLIPRRADKPLGIGSLIKLRGGVYESRMAKKAQEAQAKFNMLHNLTDTQLATAAAYFGIAAAGFAAFSREMKIRTISMSVDKTKLTNYYNSIGGPGKFGTPPPMPAPSAATTGKVKLATAAKRELKKSYADAKHFYRTYESPQKRTLKDLASPAVKMLNRMPDNQVLAALKFSKINVPDDKKLLEMYEPYGAQNVGQALRLHAKFNMKKEQLWDYLGVG